MPRKTRTQKNSLGSLRESPIPVEEQESETGSPVRVIALDDRSPSGAWSPRIPDVSATDSAYRRLCDRQPKNGSTRGRVDLPDDVLRAVSRTAYDAAGLSDAAPVTHRTKNGAHSVIHYRALTLCLDIAPDNVRHSQDAAYDADRATRAVATQVTPAGTAPGRGPGGMFALPLPVSAPAFAMLRQHITEEQFAEAADRNFKWVLEDNRQSVGERVVESDITVVVTEMVDPEAPARAQRRLVVIDGNSRLASALDQIPVKLEWLPNDTTVRAACRERLARGPKALLPSQLATMDVAQRRQLSRKVATEYAKVMASPDPREGEVAGNRTVSVDDVRSAAARKREAAYALNALTVPVRLMVSYVPDEVEHDGFAGAVRDVLSQMNLEGTKLSEGSNAGFAADSVVTALHAKAVISQARRDLLIGRAGVVAACEAENIDPDLPDLRAAIVIREMTRSTRRGNAALRSGKGTPAVTLSDRADYAAALVMRSYTASIADPRLLDTIRTACATGMLWQSLVSSDWSPAAVHTDAHVDELLEHAVTEVRTVARAEEQAARHLLAVLGMCALVFTGNLRAPGGAAEAKVGTMNRDRVGAVVDALSRSEWGLRLMADAVKRSRAGLPLRFVDDSLDLADAPTEWGTADFSNHLRALVRNAKIKAPTTTSAEDSLVGLLEKRTSEMIEALEQLVEWRNEAGISEQLAWPDVAATVSQLEFAARKVRAIADEEPRR